MDNYVGRLRIAALRPTAMLLAMPMLLGFRRANPGVKMVLMTTASVKPFAELMDVFDEYRVIDVGGAVRVPRSRLAALLRTRRTDCLVDREVHSRLTTVFTTLTLARNRIRFWLEDEAEFADALARCGQLARLEPAAQRSDLQPTDAWIEAAPDEPRVASIIRAVAPNARTASRIARAAQSITRAAPSIARKASPIARTASPKTRTAPPDAWPASRQARAAASIIRAPPPA